MVKRVVVAVLGLVLGGTALAAYLMTLSVGPYPGQSASLLAAGAGITPTMSPLYPLWRLFSGAVVSSSGSSYVNTMNLLSAIMGAACIVLLFSVTRAWLRLYSDEGNIEEEPPVVVPTIGGVVAALSLAFSVPFWVVANRAHMATFDLLLLLITVRILIRYVETLHFRWACLFVVLYGIAVPEFATMIVLAPLLGGVLLVTMWREGVLTAWRISALVGLGLLALSSYLLCAVGFYQTLGYELRLYDGFWQIIWQVWRSQSLLIMHSLPRENWLIILMMTAVPGLTVIGMGRRGLTEASDWGMVLLHMVLTVLTVGVLLNTQISPWYMLRESRILVSPYLLTSLTAGYLVCYWVGVPKQNAGSGHLFRIVMRYALCVIALLALVGVVVAAPFLNRGEADARDCASLNAYAREVVKSLEGRDLLVTDGVLDDSIELAAHDLGVPVKVLNLSASRSGVYRSLLEGSFEEQDLRSAAALGVAPLVRRLLTRDDASRQRVAVLDVPDLFGVADLTARPHRLLYLGDEPDAAFDGEALLASQREFWSALEPIITPGELSERMAMLHGYIVRRCGRLANNLGVYLEDHGDAANAAVAYRQARELDPENISALLNLGIMVEKGGLPDEGGVIATALEDLKSEANTKFHIWSLSEYFGYVRLPELYAEMGWTWARSGAGTLAKARLEQAMGMLDPEQQAGVQRIMANLHLREGEVEKGAALYAELLAANPKDIAALMGTARIEAAKGNVDAALALIARAEEAGLPALEAQLRRVDLLLASRRREAAAEVVDSLQESFPDDVRVWVAVARLALGQAGDALALDDALGRIDEIEGYGGYYGFLIRARKALSEKDIPGAFQNFESALKVGPRHIELEPLLLQLALLQSDQSAARRYATAILKRDPKDALALYMMGTIYYATGRLDFAEHAMRQSLETRRSAATLNDLAWLLAEKGELEEALALAIEGVKLSSKNYNNRDTLGVILMRMERKEKALKAFESAMAIYPHSAVVQLHLAECLADLDRWERATPLIERIDQQRDRLSNGDLDSLVELLRRTPLSGEEEPQMNTDGH